MFDLKYDDYVGTRICTEYVPINTMPPNQA